MSKSKTKIFPFSLPTASHFIDTSSSILMNQRLHSMRSNVKSFETTKPLLLFVSLTSHQMMLFSHDFVRKELPYHLTLKKTYFVIKVNKKFVHQTCQRNFHEHRELKSRESANELQQKQFYQTQPHQRSSRFFP